MSNKPDNWNETKLQWSTRTEIYLLWAQGHTHDQIQAQLESKQEKFPDAPGNRQTIGRAIKDLNRIPIELARQLVAECPVVKSQLEKKRPDLKGQLDKPDSEHKGIAQKQEDSDVPQKVEGSEQGGSLPVDTPRIHMSEAALKKHHELMTAIASEVLDILKNKEIIDSQNRRHVFSWAYRSPSEAIEEEHACIVCTGRPESLDDIDWERFSQHMESKDNPRVYHEWQEMAQELQQQLDGLLKFVKDTIAKAVSSIYPLMEKSFRDYFPNYDESRITQLLEMMRSHFQRHTYESIVFDEPCDEKTLLLITFYLHVRERTTYRDVLPEQVAFEVEGVLRKTLDKCLERPEVAGISQLDSELKQLFPSLEEELRLIIAREVIPGKCEVCGGFQE